MGTTTFSGPIKSGSAGAAGTVVLSQVHDSGDITGLGVGNHDFVLGALPAGARVVDIVVDQVVAATGGTTAVTVGTAAGGAQLAASVTTTAGGRFRGTETAATQLAWQPAAADQTVHIRCVVGTNTLTAGRFVVSVLYVQN